jgi:uncharacterized membrane protein
MPTSHDTTTSLGLERLIFFSDAVIAIAITLLAIEIRLPDTNGMTAADIWPMLVDMIPRFVSFFISFFVIGTFWMAHHRAFTHIKRYDRGLLWLNMLFLLLVAWMPFPTSVLGVFPATTPSVVLYSASVVALSLARAGLWAYATRRRRLVEATLDQRIIREEIVRSLTNVGVFGLSIAIAFMNPMIAMFSWWLVLPLFLLPARG